MVHACDRKYLGKQVSVNRWIATGRYSARKCLQSEIRKKNVIHKSVISKSTIVNGQTWSKIAAPHFQLWKHHFSESYNGIECNYILKVGKGLVEIQQAGIIILVLTFSSELTLMGNIGTNKIHVWCIKSIWFSPVEFNPTYPTNKNGVFSSYALDTFGKIWLIQVSLIATYGNKRLPQSDRKVLVLK